MKKMFLSLATMLLLSASTVTSPVAAQSPGDIVETAQAAGSFNTLLEAAQAAGLVDVLKGEGPYTVFAPTDEAFAQIPEADLNALLADEEALRSVLLYHVVPGRVLASQVVELDSAETAQGGVVTIEVEDGVVRVDEARVVSTDIQASNGIIHVIDRVLLPSE
jgi:uncharacterized surface protein with fasciclin (FAS1) repeats